MFSICDETPSRTLEPTVEPGITQRLAEITLQELPGASEATLRQVWACFRTKSADEGLVIGPDPTLERFFWVAGLGGHGMGTSWEVGRVAAAAIARQECLSVAVDPGRFAAKV